MRYRRFKKKFSRRRRGYPVSRRKSRRRRLRTYKMDRGGTRL